MRFHRKSLFACICAAILSIAWARDKCDENGFCWNDKDGLKQVCGIDQAHCRTTNNDDDTDPPMSRLYQHGGSAQTYKPSVPLDSAICNLSDYRETPHKVATWPLTRWTRSTNPPVLKLKFQLWVCSTVDKAGYISSSSECCCQSLSSLLEDGDRSRGAAVPTVTVEVWQARPDGTVSSIRPGQDDHDCRARAVVDPSVSVAEFETVAPGSVGALGGLVPPLMGWDWMPFAPPVLHVLVAAPDLAQAPVLVDVPLLLDPTTLEQVDFSMGSYWRGPGQVQDLAMSKEAVPPVQIFSWTPRPKDNEIDIVLDVFLEQTVPGQETNLSPADNATELFCEALPFGFPASFFLEPISTCAPSVLDFFPL